MGQVVCELSSVEAAIAVDEFAFAMLAVAAELSHVGVPGGLVQEVPLSMLLAVLPLSLVMLLLPAEHSEAVLLVLMPLALVAGTALIVAVGAMSLLESVAEKAVESFSSVEKVDSLSVEEVLSPVAEVLIAGGVDEEALAVSEVLVVELALVASIEEVHVD